MITVEQTSVCYGHGDYGEIYYLSCMSRFHLQWIADQINNGNIVLPEEPPKVENQNKTLEDVFGEEIIQQMRKSIIKSLFKKE